MVAARRPPRRWTLAVLLLAFVLLAAVGSLTRFYTDLLWFREIDKAQLFWGQIAAKTSLGVLAGLGTAIVIGANLWLVERLSPRYGLSVAVAGRPQVDRYRAILSPYLRPLRIGVAAFPPVVVASVVAAVVSRAFLGDHPAFPIPAQYGFTLRRATANHWQLRRTESGWRAVDRTNRVLDGRGESPDLLASHFPEATRHR